MSDDFDEVNEVAGKESALECHAIEAEENNWSLSDSLKTEIGKRLFHDFTVAVGGSARADGIKKENSAASIRPLMKQ